MGARFWDGNLVIWGGPSFANQYWHTWALFANTLAEMKGRWHHFAFVKDHNASKVKAYYDGKPVITAANTYDRWGNTTYGGKFTIGSSYGEWESLEGKMDDFRIYNRALSEPEILCLAGLAKSPIKPPAQPAACPQPAAPQDKPSCSKGKPEGSPKCAK